MRISGVRYCRDQTRRLAARNSGRRWLRAPQQHLGRHRRQRVYQPPVFSTQVHRTRRRQLLSARRGVGDSKAVGHQLALEEENRAERSMVRKNVKPNIKRKENIKQDAASIADVVGALNITANQFEGHMPFISR